MSLFRKVCGRSISQRPTLRRALVQQHPSDFKSELQGVFTFGPCQVINQIEALGRIIRCGRAGNRTETGNAHAKWNRGEIGRVIDGLIQPKLDFVHQSGSENVMSSATPLLNLVSIPVFTVSWPLGVCSTASSELKRRNAVVWSEKC